MQFKQYGELAERTAKDMGSAHANLRHFIFGAATEAGELGTMVKAHLFYGKDFNRDNAIEELGDIMWFVMQATRVLGEPYDIFGFAKAHGTGESLTMSPDAYQVMVHETFDGMASSGSIREDFFHMNMSLICSTARTLQFGEQYFVGPPKDVLNNLGEAKPKMIAQMRITVEYVAIAAAVLKVHFSTVLLNNIRKLATRYGDKYSDSAALLRIDQQGA